MKLVSIFLVLLTCACTCGSVAAGRLGSNYTSTSAQRGPHRRGILSQRVMHTQTSVDKYLQGNHHRSLYDNGETCISPYDEYAFNILDNVLTLEEYDAFVYLYEQMGLTYVIMEGLLYFGAGQNSRYAPYYPDVWPVKDQQREYKKAIRDTCRFYGIDGSQIILQSFTMHLFKNKRLILGTLVQSFKVPLQEARDEYNHVMDIFQKYPAIAYDFPLWTFPATYPVSDGTDDTPNKKGGVAMGDGYMRFLEEKGLLDIGTNYAVYHEVAHHVLFEQFGFPENTAANSRYIEMLCDALAAYFGAHPRGANLSQQDIEEFLDSAYLTGDCKFDDPSHHGTPKQRKAAAMFAIDLVQQIKAEGNTRREGHRIIPTAEFIASFDRVFPSIAGPVTFK